MSNEDSFLSTQLNYSSHLIVNLCDSALMEVNGFYGHFEYNHPWFFFSYGNDLISEHIGLMHSGIVVLLSKLWIFTQPVLDRDKRRHLWSALRYPVQRVSGT
ncbi:MAG: hypothetical protein Q7T74_02440 [Candidatus Saccharibacteria bacterium]|nr:hypothetical protein [Candidatus Saccharibacteria bacterium]